MDQNSPKKEPDEDKKVVEPTITPIFRFGKYTPIFFTLVLLVGVVSGIWLLQNTALTYKGKAAARLPSRPNTMIEKDTLAYNINKQTSDISINSAICMESILKTGSECWVVWASTDFEGKDIVAGPYPPPQQSLNPSAKTKKCPKVAFGKFDAGPSYPAICTRQTLRMFNPPLPFLVENEGILANSSHPEHINYKDPHEFLIEGQLPPGFPNPENCVLYIHYRSNRQEDVPFYAIDFCGPTPTPTPYLSPTPSPTPYPKCPNVQGPYESKSSCEEKCLADAGISDQTTYNYKLPGGGHIKCQPGENNPNASYIGDWYCCPSANCGASCTQESTTKQACGQPLMCLPPQSGRKNQIQIDTCQDYPGCEQYNECWCKDRNVPYPTIDITSRCNYTGPKCQLYCNKCYKDDKCTKPDSKGYYCAD